MFVFKPTTKTYSDPVSATFLPGIPFGREYSRGDICLINEGFQASKIFLNSKIFKSALLSSKDFLEETLDIKIIDKNSPVKDTVSEVVEMDKTTKKSTKKYGKKLALDVEDLKPEEDSSEELKEIITEENTTAEPVEDSEEPTDNTAEDNAEIVSE